MSTWSGSQPQRADQKTSQQPAKQSSVAQSPPVSLHLRCMRFLDDSRSLARIQAVCRAWSTFANYQLDLCWRPLYLRDWEAESATDECILSSGESTPWKTRYHQRSRLETNWRLGHARLLCATPFDDDVYHFTLTGTVILRAWDSGTISLHGLSGNETGRWETKQSAVHDLCVSDGYAAIAHAGSSIS